MNSDEASKQGLISQLSSKKFFSVFGASDKRKPNNDSNNYIELGNMDDKSYYANYVDISEIDSHITYGAKKDSVAAGQKEHGASHGYPSLNDAAGNNTNYQQIPQQTKTPSMDGMSQMPMNNNRAPIPSAQFNPSYPQSNQSAAQPNPEPSQLVVIACPRCFSVQSTSSKNRGLQCYSCKALIPLYTPMNAPLFQCYRCFSNVLFTPGTSNFIMCSCGTVNDVGKHPAVVSLLSANPSMTQSTTEQKTTQVEYKSTDDRDLAQASKMTSSIQANQSSQIQASQSNQVNPPLKTAYTQAPVPQSVHSGALAMNQSNPYQQYQPNPQLNAYYQNNVYSPYANYNPANAQANQHAAYAQANQQPAYAQANQHAAYANYHPAYAPANYQFPVHGPQNSFPVHQANQVKEGDDVMKSSVQERQAYSERQSLENRTQAQVPPLRDPESGRKNPLPQVAIPSIYGNDFLRIEPLVSQELNECKEIQKESSLLSQPDIAQNEKENQKARCLLSQPDPIQSEKDLVEISKSGANEEEKSLIEERIDYKERPEVQACELSNPRAELKSHKYNYEREVEERQEERKLLMEY